jgi:hypothetical protein
MMAGMDENPYRAPEHIRDEPAKKEMTPVAKTAKRGAIWGAVLFGIVFIPLGGLFIAGAVVQLMRSYGPWDLTGFFIGLGCFGIAVLIGPLVSK